MPVLPLYQTPAHPDAWHRVTAPGGYESWHFDGEDATGRFQFVATFFEGSHFDPEYLRRMRPPPRPTRHRPPLPPSTHGHILRCTRRGGCLAVADAIPAGRVLRVRRRPEVRCGPNGFTTDADGVLRLRLDGSAGRPGGRGLRLADGRR